MILGIIPARAGSKGIKGKNMYPLNGKPLIEYTIDAARRSKSILDVVVSTDMQEIHDTYFKEYDSLFYSVDRPPHLAQDDTPMVDVLQDVISSKCPRWAKAVVLLQPTSPLRTAEDIDRAIKAFINSTASSLYSGYYIGIKHKEKPYDKHSCKPHFQRNGAIFIAKRELIEQGKLWDDDVIEFEMPKSRSIDIDTMDDLFMAEAILQRRDARC